MTYSPAFLSAVQRLADLRHPKTQVGTHSHPSACSALPALFEVGSSYELYAVVSSPVLVLVVLCSS